MSYVDKSLIPNEIVTFRTRLHPIIFAWPLLFALLAIALLAYGAHAAAGFVFLIACILGLMKYLVFISSEFAVTNKRVIIKVGVFRRRTLEMLLSKVEAIAVTQGIMGRIFGCGSIVVTGTGGTHEPFANISAPLEFRRAVQAASSV
jgi:uncharacterized membrane protein YdbT with pleckstrin-like domain